MKEPSALPSWQRIRQLLDRVLDLPAEERTAAVEQADAEPALRRAVLSMLAAYEEETEPFGRPMNVQGLLGEGWREGDVIGAYRLIDRIGEGGMGTVFIAQRADDAYSKQVAVKLIRRGWASEEEIRRFRGERQILADLEHPSIARLLDGGETPGGQPYLVMELVVGQPIDVYCRHHELGLEQILGLFLEVCRAVQYAHQSLIVHRDLKPSNILVTSGDGRPGPSGAMPATPGDAAGPEDTREAHGQVKLLDFGIAKILAPAAFAEPVQPTRTGTAPMTPAYASPEQVSGQPITTATDVYSLGMLLYQLLTGDLPYRFAGHDMPAIVEAVVRRDVTAPSQRLRRLRERRRAEAADELIEGAARRPPRSVSPRALAGDLDAIVLKALAKDPKQRYATAEQLADDLERHLEHRPVRARRDTLVYRGVKFLHRYRVGLAAAFAVFGILVVSILALLDQQEDLVDERNRAREQQRRAETVTGYLVELFELAAPGRSFGEQVTGRELLDKSARTLEQELADQPRLLPELLEVLSKTYAGLGQLDEARRLAERALRLVRRQADADQLADLLYHLSDVLGQQGRYAAARQVATEALAQLGVPESRDRRLLHARALGHRGYLATRLGDRSSARRDLTRALAIARPLGDFEVTSRVLERLGALHEIDGDLDAAGDVYRQALELRRGFLDARHPSVTQLEGMIASLEIERDPRAGEKVLRQAIEDQRRLFDGPHPMLAISINNLALALEKAGDLDEAEALYDQALAMKGEIFGPSHPSIAATLLNLADLRVLRGDLEGAEQLNGEALSIFETELGPRHPDVALAKANLGKLLIERNDLEGAERLLREALDIVLEALGTGHGLALPIHVNLSEIARRRGQPEAARDILRSAIARVDRRDGGPPILSLALLNLASLEEALGDLAAAAELRREVAERDGERTVAGLYALTYTARTALDAGRWAEALALARRAADGFEARGDHPAWVHSARHTVGQALLELGRVEEAIEVLRRRRDDAATAVAAGQADAARLERAEADLEDARSRARTMSP